MIIAERPELRLKDDVAPGRPAYFWWFIANGVALCFAVASWLLCLEVFGNPEVPRNYEILRKIGRLHELKLFPADDLPDGVTLDAVELYSRFYPSPNAQLAKFNARMLRNYLTNFDSPETVVHVEGEYRIEKVRKLKEGDFISSGVVVRARAMVAPDEGLDPTPYPVWVDCVIPTRDESAAQAFSIGGMLKLGGGAKVTLLHVGRVAAGADQVLCFTVTPLAAGVFRVSEGKRIDTKAPAQVRPAAVFPLIR
ncbi:MAG: hypothetical protein KGQ87_09885 [Verrucomicrobia bacterium]|nr:hypothetical protein [Verrucomicrobiota bacterium]